MKTLLFPKLAFAFFVFLLLQGCAGGLIAAVGGAVVVSSDQRSVSTQIDDNKLAMNALKKINQMQIPSHKLRINLVTNEGYLLVIGQVDTPKNKARISRSLSTLKGVNKVYNELKVKRTIGFLKQSNDGWLTTKVKSKLAGDDKINSFQIKVVTEDAQVYLIGKVTKEVADQATNLTRKVSGVEQVNRVFQIQK
jgi:osmotically-inducible protein OsmY